MYNQDSESGGSVTRVESTVGDVKSSELESLRGGGAWSRLHVLRQFDVGTLRKPLRAERNLRGSTLLRIHDELNTFI